MALPPGRTKHWVLGLLALCALTLSSAAAADPPSRVARLAHISGAVSFSPAGEDEWVAATANRPLISGDRVWVDAGARAELQFGAAAIRLGADTSLAILNLDDRVAQFQLAQGTVNVHVRRLGRDDVVEIDTPQLAFTMRRAGEVRIDVDAQGATAIAMLNGDGEAWGESAALTIAAGQWYRFSDSALRNYRVDVLPAPDDFDRWAFDRDRREERGVASRYVAPEVIGYSDLDDYGSWSVVENYGNVWIPTSVPSGWAPYRYGHWAWIEPWGWTWVDNAPWGFAPFHYGRWAYARERWCWVPGPVRAHPIYAPALVAFVGGGNFRLSLSSGASPGIGWFPLGPGEVYRPSYRVSRNYFTNVNVSNTQINTTYVTNVYNNPGSASVNYQNRQRPNAITAVPTSAFVQSRPVAQAAVPLSVETVSRTPTTPFAAVAPTRASVTGAASAGQRPPSALLQRPVVARTPPAPTVAPFVTREQSLARDPGRPLDPAAAAALAPAARAPAFPVRVLTPTQTATPAPAAQTISRPGSAPGSEAVRAGAPAPAPTPPATRPLPPSATTSAAPPSGGAPPPAPPNASAFPPPGTVSRTAPPAGNVPPPRPQVVAPQPPITASPPVSPVPTPSNAPAFAPPRPVPPSTTGEVRRVPVPPAGEISAQPPAPQDRRREIREDRGIPMPPPATIAQPPVPQPPAATTARPPAPPPAPQPVPAPEVRRAAPPAPQPAPAPEVRRTAPPAQIAAPPEGAQPEARGAPRHEKGKPEPEEKKPDAK